VVVQKGSNIGWTRAARGDRFRGGNREKAKGGGPVGKGRTQSKKTGLKGLTKGRVNMPVMSGDQEKRGARETVMFGSSQKEEKQCTRKEELGVPAVSMSKENCGERRKR